ncbi:MAG: cytochrome P450 [Chloroflexi bacterium]|nr:MAG: cytochrome P450 [Chloroflexota bacterium]
MTLEQEKETTAPKTNGNGTTQEVRDWASDYDIFARDYIKDPFPVWDELREKCPIAHTERWGGSWMPTRYADLFAIAQDFQHFSSRDVLVAPMGAGDNAGDEALDIPEALQNYEVGAPPITSDPPIHTWARRLLLSPFSVQAIAKWEPETRELCRSLIDGFIDKGRCDAAADYAQQIPPRIIASMLGIPKEMSNTFTDWVRGFLEFGLQNAEIGGEAGRMIFLYLWDRIQEHKQNPKDDLITYLLSAEVDGQPVPETHVLGTSFLLLLAGIDTTWSSIGSALWHLAQHPEHRARLVAEPGLIPTAVEELLRAYSPVTMARYVAEDTEYNGCKFAEGERILMNFPAANRDPEKFPDPDKVVIDRAVNPHIAFGVGIHRCAGSNLARMEMRVSIEEWLKRIPDFRLEDPEAVTWAGGQVRGPRSMPVVFS